MLCQLVLVMMPPVRLDLTEKRLFTLSEGSVHILRDIRTPVALTLYYSEKEARPYPQFRQYATRVIEKVEEYAAQSGGRITFRVLDPEPYSATEDAAIANGIAAIPLEDGSGPLYFGLTALSEGRSKAIGFVKPEAEEHLEYELSKLIRSVQRIDRPKVALVTELPVTGNANPAFGPVTPAWVAFRQLSERYEMVTLSPRALKIPDDVDVLWVMHPRGWPADSLSQIQNYINAGRHAVILLDPNAESVPVFGTGGELSLGSDAAALLQPWGIVFNPGQVVLDSKYAWLMQLNENQFPKRNPGLISLPGAAMNQSDVVTADLDRIVLSSAGALDIRDSSLLRIEPLLQSSDASRPIDAVAYRSAADDPEKLLNQFVSSQEPFVLAARFTGAPPRGEKGAGINFIVIGDTDFLSDRLWVLESNLFGEPVFSAQASNGDFFFNIIDQLSGSDDLISIRSRGMVSRPFEKVDQLRRTAEQRYRDSQVGLLAELDRVQAEINALQDGGKTDAVLESPRRNALAARKITLRKQLRRIQRELNEDVESLGQRIKLLNIFALPFLLLIVAGVIAVRRRMFKDYARVGGHGAA
ncbi:Gldg family protein [Arenimonas sp. GDDSR-1]|uniref:Gldg family protein n=1 Tax=Arenimonas sp. GDDSR-1 TaxID=2950125 RepID=UPI00260334AB|nr:Gldg family protein [Arenimonas sp. GDDSR-1]